MLDNLSEGRLELGIGRGVSNIEMKFYNVSVDQSRARFDEALEVIKLGLTRPVLDHQGEFYDYDMVPMEMRPVQQPHPPFWYPTSNLQSVPWVAKNGFNTVFAGHLDHVAQQVASYREHSDPSIGGGGRKLGIHPFIVVAPTDGEALRVGEAAYAAHQANLSHLAKWKGRSAELTRVRNLPSLATLAEAIESGLAAAGSPGAVADQLAAIIDKTGCNYILYTPTSGDTPFAFATRALELFADKVLPALG